MEPQADPQRELAAGEVLLRIDHYGLSSNNITYGLLGDALRYWDFFPAQASWGRIPVWGYADVVASRVPELSEGERVFGYLPMSQHLVVRPARINPALFVDASEHRSALPPLYQQYFRTPRGAADEQLRTVLRPLYGTGFLLDDWLADNAQFGARRVLLASASSKTALSAAFTMARRASRDFEIVALTSGRNAEFCGKVGYYDRVISYPELTALSGDVPSMLIDMAGDPLVTRQVHTQLGAALVRSSIVGLTHQGSLAPAADLPGPKPELFFAPDHIQKRTRELGPEEFRRRLDESQDAFFESTRGWLELVHAMGPVGIEQAYLRVLNGQLAPSQAMLLQP